MASSAPAPMTPPTWQIEYQRQTTWSNPAGGFTQGVEVGFVTSHGVHASVQVPYAEYNPDRVKQIIQGRVDLIDQVHNLAG